jgi:hypothetical protein
MQNTDDKTETTATARMRELAARYALIALDLEHPAPHWNIERELAILATSRAHLAAAAAVWRLERGIADGRARGDDATDALCAAARAYYAARTAYVSAPGKADYSACAAAWSAVEQAAAL